MASTATDRSMRAAPDVVLPVRRVTGGKLPQILNREWLVTNGLGGYASGTLSGAATRRYHGLLVAAHPAPLGRVMLFNHLTENFRFPDFSTAFVGGIERRGGELDIHGAEALTEFRLEGGLPVWRYEARGHIFEKRIYMPHQRNTVHIAYRMLEGNGTVRLKLRPSVHFRGHDDHVSTKTPEPYTLIATEQRYELQSSAGNGFPPLRLRLRGTDAALTLDGQKSPEILYRVEERRGYEGVGVLWSPGFFRVNLSSDHPVILSASTESWDTFLAADPDEALERELDRRKRLIVAAVPSAREGIGAELVLAADQFVIKPGTRTADTARAHAAGEDARTVVAGYHWFTDWGRDTMISLDGLTVVTGRIQEAAYILHTFASHVRDGLIPNFFPDKENEGVYHTADATLWFFHAIARFTEASGNRETLRLLLPTLRDIVDHHIRGTRFGIHVDPDDGLLCQGAEGYQLTWMDAKCGDWVVTPRRGKAVEINALWYNALRLMEQWLGEEQDPAASAEMRSAADRAYASFNRRFWCEEQNGLFDVVDGPQGDDPSCRPNQLFAISLPHPVLEPSRWQAVVETCRSRLLTPVGLRSLAPGNPEYKSRYFGDLRSRDAAYHQGTVWAWLIGPFIDAWRKTYPDRLSIRELFLSGFNTHLSEACIGSISEVFDAEEPFTPRGCIAQAWSVAEVLRCWAESE